MNQAGRFVGAALVTTGIVLLTIFVARRIPVVGGVVDRALRG